jgi:hypothetical protein
MSPKWKRVTWENKWQNRVQLPFRLRFSHNAKFLAFREKESEFIDSSTCRACFRNEISVRIERMHSFIARFAELTFEMKYQSGERKYSFIHSFIDIQSSLSKPNKCCDRENAFSYSFIGMRSSLSKWNIWWDGQNAFIHRHAGPAFEMTDSLG